VTTSNYRKSSNTQPNEKKEQVIHRISKRKEIIKIRAGISEIESKRTIQRINETKSWYFEKMNKIYKPLARLTKKETRCN
jgi:hypothetical protein